MRFHLATRANPIWRFPNMLMRQFQSTKSCEFDLIILETSGNRTIGIRRIIGNTVMFSLRSMTRRRIGRQHSWRKIDYVDLQIMAINKFDIKEGAGS